MDKFTIRLSDAQFKVIVERIDPEKNNAIDYHDFLELFEVRGNRGKNNNNNNNI